MTMTTGNQPSLLQGNKKKLNSTTKNIRSYPKPNTAPKTKIPVNRSNPSK